MSAHRKLPAANDDAIEEAAATWLSERDVGFTSEQATGYECWLAANPKHAAAVAMLEETRALLGQMPVLRGNPSLRRRMQAMQNEDSSGTTIVRFPRVLKMVAALAACLTLALGLWSLQRASGEAAFTEIYATAVNDYRRIVLPDHSVMELNEGTRVLVDYSRAQRRVSLQAGEAHFTVAKNPARPFLVNAQRVGIRAVGTAFTVKLDPAAVEVVVTEGRVEVHRDPQPRADTRTEAADSEPPVFSAGQRVVVAIGAATTSVPHSTAIDQATTARLLAWRTPRLVFAETSLADVVQEFNRHNRLQLEIADVELRKHAVGGTFRANEVESFVRLLENSGDVSVERPAADRIVLRKVVLSPRP